MASASCAVPAGAASRGRDRRRRPDPRRAQPPARPATVGCRWVISRRRLKLLVVLSWVDRCGDGCGSSTVRAPRPTCGPSEPGDHRDQRTSQRPGSRHRAPFEHRSVHLGRSNDLVGRKPAGQSVAVSAPPGTRTPNPRIKSHIVGIRLVSARVVSAGQQQVTVPLGAVRCRPGPRPPSTDRAPRPWFGAPSNDRGGGVVTRLEQRISIAGRRLCAAAVAIDGLRRGAAEHRAPAEDDRELAPHNVRLCRR